jgi:hypothetical protein
MAGIDERACGWRAKAGSRRKLTSNEGAGIGKSVNEVILPNGTGGT